MKKQHKVLLLGLMVCAGFWILDAVLDFLVFYKGQGSFLDLLIFNIPAHEMYVRSLAIGMVIVFSLIAANYAGQHTGPEKKIYAGNGKSKAALWIFLKVIGVTFVCEAAIMAFLHWRGPAGRSGIILDPLLLGTLTTPFLYALIVKPVYKLLREHEEAETQMVAANQQLQASGQQLRAANQQLTASEQQLKASNQQLQAGEQQLRASNQQLKTEITERKKTERELENVFELSPDMMCVCNIEGEFLRVSPSWENVLGYTVDEIIKLGWAKLVHPDDLGRAGNEVEKQVKGHSVKNFINRFRCKDGTYKIFEWQATSAIEDVVYAIARDVTERKRDEENLLWYQGRLRELASELAIAEERERHRIATDLHDGITQDLLLLKMKLAQMGKSARSTESADGLAQMVKAVEKMVQTTRSLMFDLSPPVLYELGFESAVKWLAETTRKQYDIEVSIEDDGQDKPLSEAVRVGLFRIMRELIQNVVKHAQARTIEISTRLDGPNIRVQVKDDGVGFDAVEAQSRKDMKSSFGLFYARERLTHLGGDFQLESKPGQGTRATLIAPIEQQGKIR